jgi:hypothetical protein
MSDTQVDWLDSEEAEYALGFMCFQLGPMAHIYQELGIGPAKKAEAEQAFMLRKFLKMVREHGPKWNEFMQAELRETLERVKVQRAEKEKVSA